MTKKLVVITGASSGFGLEMAKLFSENDYPTLLLARRTKGLEEMNLKNSLVRKVDVLDYESFKQAIEEAEKKYGDVDLLINNAGVMLLGSIIDQDVNEWSQMLNVNIAGVANGMQLVLNKMNENNSGTIINISSIAGIKTFANHAMYCATKYGVRALTETTREEVSSNNVRVSLISPGAAETELLSHTTNSNIIDGYNEWKETMGGKSMDAIHVANAAKYIYELPQDVCIREIVIAPTKQDS